MIKLITHMEAEQLIKKHKDMIVADVRDIESYKEEHIYRAIHLNMTKLQEFCDRLDKNQPILVYCYHGISSQSVGQHLIEQGFRKVYSLIGGFETWKACHPTSDTQES